VENKCNILYQLNYAIYRLREFSSHSLYISAGWLPSSSAREGGGGGILYRHNLKRTNQNVVV
jgi:hypothetical protein